MSMHISIAWLRIACVVTVFTGVICALASHPATAGAWLFLFDVLRWPLDGDPAFFAADTRAVNAVLGGTMVGWGVLMFLLASRDHMKNNPALPRMMLVALGAWFVVDSVGSFMAELPGNVVLNVAFMGLFVPPLVAIQRRLQSGA
jgi:hypothetical protein